MQAPAFFAELRFYDFLYRVCLMAVASGAPTNLRQDFTITPIRASSWFSAVKSKNLLRHYGA